MTSRLPLIFILNTLMIDSMGIGLILPVMPDLIQEVDGGSLARAALWGGVLSTVFAVFQFLFAPLLGALSDRYGRRPILLVALFVMALDYLVLAVAGSMWLLVAGRVIGGVTAATQATANAFIADISAPEDKAARFGLAGAAFGLGFVIGPLVGGWLAGIDTRAPFYAAAILAGANCALGYFVLPETVTDRIRRPFTWSRAHPLGALRKVSELPGIGRLVLVFFLYSVAFYVYPAVWAFFTQAQFGWDAGLTGVSLALFGIAVAIVQGGLIRLFLKWLGTRGTIVYGICFNFLAFLAMGTVQEGWLALLFVPLTALGAVVTPALQGLMSRRLSDDSQGELQGVLTSTGALAVIFSPMIMTALFAAFTAPGARVFFPGAPFILSMGLMAVCLAIYLSVPRRNAS